MKLKLLAVCGLSTVLAIPLLAENVTAPLKPEYQKWLNEDVRWIITSREREEFVNLTTNPARDRFVVQFWEHRNPEPGNKENLFKHEHYRRLTFSNEHFAAGVSGDETDRGRIYIVYGPPDAITTHSSGAHPDQLWTYRRLNGDSNTSFRFVDRCSCGDFRLLDDHSPSN